VSIILLRARERRDRSRTTGSGREFTDSDNHEGQSEKAHEVHANDPRRARPRPGCSLNSWKTGPAGAAWSRPTAKRRDGHDHGRRLRQERRTRNATWDDGGRYATPWCSPAPTAWVTVRRLQHPRPDHARGGVATDGDQRPGSAILKQDSTDLAYALYGGQQQATDTGGPRRPSSDPPGQLRLRGPPARRSWRLNTWAATWRHVRRRQPADVRHGALASTLARTGRST